MNPRIAFFRYVDTISYGCFVAYMKSMLIVASLISKVRGVGDNCGSISLSFDGCLVRKRNAAKRRKIASKMTVTR